MERALVNSFVWRRAEAYGVVGLVALQVATHGAWLPPLPEAARIRACCATLRWCIEKRVEEMQESPSAQEGGGDSEPESRF